VQARLANACAKSSAGILKAIGKEVSRLLASDMESHEFRQLLSAIGKTSEHLNLEK